MLRVRIAFVRILSLILVLCCFSQTCLASVSPITGLQDGIREDGLLNLYEVSVEPGVMELGGYSSNAFQSVDYECVPVPSADNPSVKIMPREAVTGGQFWFDINSLAENLVIESSIRLDGTPGSTKRFFTVDHQKGSYIIFATIEKDRSVVLFDGTVAAKLVPGRFYNIKFVINTIKHTYDVVFDGKTVVKNGAYPSDRAGIKKLRMHLMAGASVPENCDEDFYINYIRAYPSDKILTKAEFAEKVFIPKVIPEPADMESRWASPDEVTDVMKDNILMLINDEKVRVGEEVKYIDEENHSAVPFYLNGTTMVPLRFLSENLGATVSYNNADRTVNITKGGHTINFKIGSKKYTLDGNEKSLSEAPIEKDGRTYVPLRAISEGLGTKVFWDKAGLVGVGDNADKFDGSTEKGRNILFEAIRPAVIDTPTVSKIVEDFKKTSEGVHPRVILTADRIEEIKKEVETDPIMKKWSEKVIAGADSYVKKPLVEFKTTDGLRATSHSQTAQHGIMNCAMAYHLTGKEEYKKRAIDELINVSELPNWNPNHFLDVGEMCAGVGLGYDWLYNEMTDTQRKTIENAIVKNAIEPCFVELDPIAAPQKSGYDWAQKYATDGKSVNADYPSNWIAVCAGGITMGALAIGDIYPDLMGDLISKAFFPFSDLIFNYAFDGACVEGGSYWRYAGGYIAMFSAGLCTVLGTDYGLYDIPGYINYMDYETTLTAPTGFLNIDMSPDNSAENPIFILWAARRYNEPELLNKYIKRPGADTINSGGTCLRMVWYKPEWYDPNYTPKRNETYMRQMEVVTMSTQGYGVNDMFVMLRGKVPSSKIVETDGGHFMLDALGVRWSRDAGKTMENYFTNQLMPRLAYYSQRAEGHSTIVINPHYGSQQAHARAAVMEKTQWGTTKNLAITDLTELYRFVGVNSARRGVMLDTARQYVTLRDEVTSDEPMNFYWFMQLQANIEVEISEDGKTAVLYSDGKKLSAQILSEGDYKFEVTAATNLEESPHPNDMISQGRAKRLTIHTEGLTKINLTVGFTTLAGEQKSSDYTPEILPLDEWEVDNGAFVTPKLTGIYADGKLLEDFSPNKYVYEFDFDVEAPIPQFSATCSEDYKVEITQPVDEGKGGGVGKITVINKNNETERHIYYILVKKPALNIWKTAASPDEVMPILLYAEHVPQASNIAEQTMDGDLNTRWSSDRVGTAIDYYFGEQAVEFNTVAMALASGDERTTEFSISISDDGKTWTEIHKGRTAGDTLDMVNYNVGNKKAKYVRLQGYGNSDGSKWFSVTEVSFYNKK